MKDKKRRYFEATYSRTETATGIGLIELNKGHPLLIESIYIDERLSNRESMSEILRIIYEKLAENEIGLLKSDQFRSLVGIHVKYNDEIKARYQTNKKGQLQDVKDLSLDALKRGSTIIELF